MTHPVTHALDSLSDEVLVTRAQAGESEAFDALVLRYQHRLYGILYNMTSNHQDTNDLLMEVFEKAYRSLGSFKREAAFYTWLYRVAMNHAFNWIEKRKKFRKDISLNDLDLEDGLAKNLFDASFQSDPRKQAYLKELQIELNESMQKLSEEHRAVIVLFDMEDLSHAEIARILDCSEGTVRSRLHYAHKYLQKSLSRFLNQDF